MTKSSPFNPDNCKAVVDDGDVAEKVDAVKGYPWETLNVVWYLVRYPANQIRYMGCKSPSSS